MGVARPRLADKARPCHKSAWYLQTDICYNYDMKNTISLPNLSGTSRNRIISRSFTRGFTLIEMMVVIAIIAILSGIIMANLSGAKAKARDSKRISDMGQIQLALGMLFDRCDKYPVNGPRGAFHMITSTVCIKNSSNSYSILDFIALVPAPSSEAGQTFYDYATNDPTGSPTDYILHAKLESPNAAVTSGLSALYLSSRSSWTSGITCDNSPSSLDYCLGPK